MQKRLITLFISLLSIISLSAKEIDEASAIEAADTVTANDKTVGLISRNIFIEFGGPSFGVGIGYDRRFKPKSVFGFRTGLSFTNGSVNDGGWWGAYSFEPYTNVDFKGITLPLEVNAIMGKRASKFELGVGLTPCILHRKETHYSAWDDEQPEGPRKYFIKKGIKANVFGTINFGYRLQRKSGFFLRTGFTFLIGDIKSSPIDGLYFIPNISFGYTIR